MKIYVVSMKDVLKYLVIFLITISALIGSREYIADVSKNIIRREFPIYSVQRDDKKIALTFDSAWENKDIPSILETLKNNDVKATFFSTGGWYDRYPDSVRMIRDAGHELGNHSATHPHIKNLSKDKIVTEIMDVHTMVKDKYGFEMKSFRPPYGEYNDLIVRTARELGYQIVQWDVDSWDWMDIPKEKVIDRVVNNKKLMPGSIILMHSGAKHTQDVLDEIIKGLKGKGYEFTTVSDLIYKDNYMINHEGKQIKKDVRASGGQKSGSQDIKKSESKNNEVKDEQTPVGMKKETVEVTSQGLRKIDGDEKKLMEEYKKVQDEKIEDAKEKTTDDEQEGNEEEEED